jgi:hypothetical protein
MQVKKFCHLAIVFLLAAAGAAVLAYAMALVHHALGFSRSALREQALICAALIVVLVMIEMLASTET